MTYTLVISSYGYGHLAGHAIESALAQSKPFDKILFVDDAAGDCFHLQAIYGDRVEFLYRQTNLGTVANFQDMLNRVQTEYVMFLGADNWLRPDALSRLTLMYPMPDVLTYDIIVTGELKDDIHKNYHHSMYAFEGQYYWSRKMVHHGSMLYRTELAKSLGGYEHNRTSDKTDEDMNLWNKFLKAGAKVGHVEQGLLYYRRHKENFNKY